MNIREMNCDRGSITIDMRDTELRTLTNLLCKARKHIEFSVDELAINAKLFIAITIRHHGMIPEFEREHINELFRMANEKMDGKDGEGK